MKRLFAVVGLCLLFVGCTSFEKSARDSVAAANGVLVVLQRQNGQCKLDPSQPVCQRIKQGIAAQNLAIDALEVYCSGPAFEAGGACQPPSDPALKNAAEVKLNAAIASLNTIVVDLKGLVKP
jgi:hypothetical protein